MSILAKYRYHVICISAISAIITLNSKYVPEPFMGISLSKFRRPGRIFIANPISLVHEPEPGPKSSLPFPTRFVYQFAKMYLSRCTRRRWYADLVITQSVPHQPLHQIPGQNPQSVLPQRSRLPPNPAATRHPYKFLTESSIPTEAQSRIQTPKSQLQAAPSGRSDAHLAGPSRQ